MCLLGYLVEKMGRLKPKKKEEYLMKKVIGNKIYDTEKSKLIAKYSNGLHVGDFKHLNEDLYLSPNGQFFLHARGGPMTIYSEKIGNYVHGVETLILFTDEEAFNWLRKYDEVDKIEELFENLITEG